MTARLSAVAVAVLGGSPHASLSLYSGAGHGFLFQGHSAFAARVTRFLG